MALIKSGPTAPKPMDPIQVKIHSPIQKTATVDTNYTPRASLLQYVDGSPWEVEYYSQVLGADSEPGPWQLDRAATDQQYVKISQMEIRAVAPLSEQEEQPGRSHTVSGSAIMYPHTKPNIGDCFIADIGDGRRALLGITAVARTTYMKESYNEIEYSVIDYVDNKPHIISDLNRKTVKRTVFYKEFLTWGQNPQLLEGEYEDLIDLKQILRNLINYFFRDFYSIQYQTLLIPGQPRPAVDPFLTRAILDWITPEEAPQIQRLKAPVVRANRNSDVYTIWSALTRMDRGYLTMGIEFMRLMDSSMFRGMPEISSVYYQGLGLVACPLDNRTDVDVDYEGKIDPCSCGCQESFVGGITFGVTGLRWKDLLRYTPSRVLDGFDPQGFPDQLPDIVPVTIDEYYVLSGKFYRPSGPMASKLEVLVKQAVDQESIDKVTLLKLARNCHQWPNLERFYYMPILFALIKVALRTN